MTQKDKQLLLKDLCARVPYGVRYRRFAWDDKQGEECISAKIYSISPDGYVRNYHEDESDYIDNVRPYLFPLSSMTEGQKEELNKKFNVQFLGNTIYSIHYHSEGCWDTDLELDLQDWLWFINWCYKNHFDIYGLIPMGLAIDATGLNVY